MLLSQQQKAICGSDRLAAPLGMGSCSCPHCLNPDPRPQPDPTVTYSRIFYNPTILGGIFAHLLSPIYNDSLTIIFLLPLNW